MRVKEWTAISNPFIQDRGRRWTQADNIATENEVIMFIQGLMYAMHPNYVIETGAYKGDMTSAIGHALRNPYGYVPIPLNVEWDSHMDTFEINAEHAEEASKRTQDYPVTVHPYSWEEFTPTQPIDFIWIDDLPENRMKVFHHFYPYMHRNTLVGFHDYMGHQIVHDQVNQLITEKWINGITLPTPRGLYLANVKPPE